ncbi:hypothetical protein [Paracoccus fistulariae]|uniref:Uncharacterized protein n=1 Tax=Paracoccus fistulariae TaxID=658446 RepID=A0ABY7SH14_9RHOB|nr:hypothetical protein [Paracoccus fistulariae]WCR06190.1 hypothetical protein JHX87_11875 [Paracoccus fistulariae]
MALQVRVAIRLNSLSSQKKFSIKCRHSYISGLARNGLASAWMLRDDNFCTALIELRTDVVAIERLVNKLCAEFNPIDERGYASCVEAAAGHQVDAVEVSRATVRASSLVVIPHLEWPVVWL